MSRRTHRLVAIPMAVLLLLGAVAPVAADDPADGSVQLADGQVLPPPPVEILEPGVHGEMLVDNPEAAPMAAGPEPSVALAEPAGVGTITGDATTLQTGTVLNQGPAGALPNNLTREVLGFLPHWMLSELGSMRYDLVSTIAYFGIPANADGTLNRGSLWTAWNSSAMTTVINNAHSRGVRVVPTITLMSWDGDYAALSALLTSASNRARLVGEIVSAIRSRNADGVNIDFEPVPSSLRSQFTTFIRELKAGLVNGGVPSYLTVDTMAGAATWATGYDVVGLTAAGAADAIMVMAYDFHYAGSARAGGVAPIDSAHIFAAGDALRDHLEVVHPSKIIWGIPYYGRSWATETDQLNSLTRPQTPGRESRAWGYPVGRDAAAEYGRRWDGTGQVPWFAYWDAPNSTVRQGYYDDPQSLALKYEMVHANNLAGIGIWSLLMDAGTPELWNLLAERFVGRVGRLYGADRFATAATLSSARFGPGVPAVVLATGRNYPDALAGASLAAANGGPVLLVTESRLTAATEAELARLRPRRIFVLGGTGVIPDSVAALAARYASEGVTRIAGADRFETAAAVSRALASPGVQTVYIATGSTFPDALSGAAVAARDRMPILLVTADQVPAATAAELNRLQPQRIVILGGPGAVSDAVAAALDGYTAGTVTRLGGADRYATSVAISVASFAAGSVQTVYVASGGNYPDALAAGPVAGRERVPVLLVRSNALPANVADELRRLDPDRVVIVGGPGGVSDGVAAAIRALWP